MLFVAGIVGVLTAVAVPQVSATLNRSRGLAAARYLASRMALARAQAVSRSANVALRFDSSRDGAGFGVFIDGDGNGVRTADIASGVDPALEPFVRLTDLFPRVRIAFADGGGEEAGVRVGASRLLSFTSSGTATSGSVYVLGADGTQWAVRVLGTTGRTRVLRYIPATRAWVPAF